MNDFDCGAFKRSQGWIGYYRMVHRAENFILRDGKHDIIFPTKIEAKEAAWTAFLKYLNSPISGLVNGGTLATESADSVFSGLKPFVKQKARRVPVQRRAIA